MHLGFGDGSRLGAFLSSVFYLIGVPIFLENYNGHSNQSTLGIFSPILSELPANCYEGLGCVKSRYLEQKGYNLSPNLLEDVTPTICFYNKQHLQSCQMVESDTLRSSHFTVANGSNYWIGHGYIENGQRPWIKDLVKELLSYEPLANVFVIDWSEATKPPYNQAVENIEMIAAYCGNLMVELQEEYGLDISQTHFIGHSLGAHLAGYLGAWLQEHKNEKIGRITGLDPAQLYFQGLPPDAKLDHSDASFVDVIHTDAKPFLNGGEVASSSSINIRPVSGLGTQEPSGHADFYPNGGKEQPGCKDGVYQAILQEDGSVINGIRRYLGCDHIRSYEYFTESIRSSCPFMAFACASWQAFADSTCKIDHYNKLGFHATKPSGNDEETTIYYSMTGARPPFCREHYKVAIHLAEESKYRSTSELHLVLGNSTSNGPTTTVLNLGIIDFTGKHLVRNYTVNGINNGFPSKLTLRPSSSNPLRWLVNRVATPEEPDVVVANITLFHLESLQAEVTFCPDEKNFFSATEQNPSIMFSKNDSC